MREHARRQRSQVTEWSQLHIPHTQGHASMSEPCHVTRNARPSPVCSPATRNRQWRTGCGFPWLSSRRMPPRPRQANAPPCLHIQVKSSRVKSSRVKSSRAKSSQVEPSRAKSSQVEPSRAKSSQVEPSRVKSSQGASHTATLQHAPLHAHPIRKLHTRWASRPAPARQRPHACAHAYARAPARQRPHAYAYACMCICSRSPRAA